MFVPGSKSASNYDVDQLVEADALHRAIGL